MDYFFDNIKGMNQKGRVEGVAKVTGKATYSAEYDVPNLAHAVLVGSTVASGKISTIDTADALTIPGVIDVLTYKNRPEAKGLKSKEAIGSRGNLDWAIFHTEDIYFNGQPIAMVVAETFEDAVYASTFIKATYQEAAHKTDFETIRDATELELSGKNRGDSEWESNSETIDQEYLIDAQVHNPMEMHATIAQWSDDEHLKLYEKSQGLSWAQGTLSSVFGIPADRIHIISTYVGGGFGAALKTWPHTAAAAMAAKQVNRPVKVMLTRNQMFNWVGYRPESWQRVKLGADTSGRFTGVLHQSKHNTSTYGNFSENIVGISRKVYGFQNLVNQSAVVPLNRSTPTWMRGPGDSSGSFGVESAIDELSYKLDIDPVELRLMNLPKTDPETGKPFSSHYIKECLQQGAEKIGWSNRQPKPRMTNDGDWLVGYGVGVGLWNAGRGRASAMMELTKDGTLAVGTSMTDIGTGSAQAMLNLAHENLGIPKANIKVKWGDSDLPSGATQGGSRGLASLAGSIVDVSKALKIELALQASKLNKAFLDSEPSEVSLDAKGVSLRSNSTVFVSYEQLWSENQLDTVRVETTAKNEVNDAYVYVSSAAHFVKLRVHPATGRIKIDRMVCVVDAGKIVNEKAAANQIIGAAVGGIGMALLETQDVDHGSGRLIGNDFAGYHVTVQADAPIIEVSFIGIPDPHLGKTGAKGLGEVGLIGCAPAITSAIYNATGQRHRHLPVTPDKVVMAQNQKMSSIG